MSPIRRTRCLMVAAVVALIIAAWLAPSTSHGGAARLKNGMLIEGTPVKIMGMTLRLKKQNQGPTEVYPILMIADGMRRYFVADRQVKDVDKSVNLGGQYEVFKLRQKKTGRKIGPVVLGGVIVLKPFNRFGRRTVSVRSSRGTIAIVLGVTKITPKHLTVEGITHIWEHGIAVTSIPQSTLDAMLRTATQHTNPQDRMAIARFYMQAGYYPRASAELQSIIRDFPAFQARVQQIDNELKQLQAQRILDELSQRQHCGQHRLAYEAAKNFPKKRLSAAVMRRVHELMRVYDEGNGQIERARDLLGALEARLEDKKKLAAVKPMRAIVREQLDFETLGRLDPFLKLAADDSLKPGQKLALAYSGWVLGAAHAVTNLDLAVRLWDAKFLVLEYLRTVNTLKREALLDRLRRIEGVEPKHYVRIVAHLPPIIETAGLPVRRPAIIQAPGLRPGQKIKYAAMLPFEYNPHHDYPMVVALRPLDRPIEDELLWWAGSPQKAGPARHKGYIVIAPEYAAGKKGGYDYSMRAHHAVIAAIRDARKRFSVDSDRIFLSGHGDGGDAAFDIGMSHPHLFAGVIPISGISDKYCKWYWQNCKYLPFYCINGELARNSKEANSREINRMLRRDFDVTYVEFIGRGYESFYDEVHRIFDWMSLYERKRSLKEVNVQVLRPSDSRFFWIEAAGFPKNVTHNTVLLEGGRRPADRPMILSARSTPGNTIYVKSGARRHTLWLSPEIVNFEKRVAVRFGGKQRFNNYLKFDLQTMLEDLRIRGDRQKLYWARIDF